MLVIIYCLITSSIIAQDKPPLDYMRGGIGLAFLGSGDVLITKLEFEYITPINRRLILEYHLILVIIDILILEVSFQNKEVYFKHTPFMLTRIFILGQFLLAIFTCTQV